MDDKQLLEFLAEKGNGIVARLQQSIISGDAPQAATTLMSRIVEAGNSLRELYDNANHDWSFDGNLILRAIYDAMLQALYILHDDNERDERARRFLDFAVIERVKLMRLFDKNPTPFAQRMSTSTLRANVEPAIEREFQQVCRKYDYSEVGPPEHWYQGSLRDLAKDVGYETEYELLQKQLSGIVHCSLFALRDVPRYRDFHLLSNAWHFSFRVLAKVAKLADIHLDQDESRLITLSERSIFEG